jgi:integrase
LARGSNLHRRGATYYFVVNVPADLQADMGGKKQIWRSLGTKDLAEAKRRRAAIADQWAASVDDMRRRKELSESDMAAAVWDHYATGLEEGDRERTSRPTDGEIWAAFDKAMADARQSGVMDAGPIAMTNALTEVEILANKAQWDARRRATRLKRLRADLGSGDTRLIEPEADAFITKHRFLIAKGDPRYRELCFRLMRADIEQLERYAERDRGDFTGQPKDPIVIASEGTAPVDALKGETIMAVFEKFERENPNGVQQGSITQIRRDVRHFSDFVGRNTPLSKLTKRNVREWKELLLDWPVKAADVTDWKGMSARKIVAANNASKKPKRAISKTTVRRYMGSLSVFCTWLANNDYLEQNPLRGLIPKKEDHNRPWSFTDEQLKKLFNAPLFTGCQKTTWRGFDVPGDVHVRDHRYWIPYVMAYSGARLGEIAQLHVENVREQHGIWIMHITTEGEDRKRVKTKGSMRVVPIHSELIRLGFVEHCQKMAEAGHKQIFPEIKIPKSGQVAPSMSREFNRYLTRLGIKSGPKIVLYSLRHTFVDGARRAGFLDEEIGLVLGHGKATMTGRYGTEQQGTLERRAMIVEAVKYRLD